VPPNQRTTAATTSERPAARSAPRIGGPAVPDGSPASAARSAGGQPTRQAKQTWLASG
jgi:hypothetical protein